MSFKRSPLSLKTTAPTINKNPPSGLNGTTTAITTTIKTTATRNAAAPAKVLPLGKDVRVSTSKKLSGIPRVAFLPYRKPSSLPLPTVVVNNKVSPTVVQKVSSNTAKSKKAPSPLKVQEIEAVQDTVVVESSKKNNQELLPPHETQSALSPPRVTSSSSQPSPHSQPTLSPQITPSPSQSQISAQTENSHESPYTSSIQSLSQQANSFYADLENFVQTHSPRFSDVNETRETDEEYDEEIKALEKRKKELRLLKKKLSLQVEIKQYENDIHNLRIELAKPEVSVTTQTVFTADVGTQTLLEAATTPIVKVDASIQCDNVVEPSPNWPASTSPPSIEEGHNMQGLDIPHHVTNFPQVPLTATQISQSTMSPQSNHVLSDKDSNSNITPPPQENQDLSEPQNAQQDDRNNDNCDYTATSSLSSSVEKSDNHNLVDPPPLVIEKQAIRSEDTTSVLPPDSETVSVESKTEVSSDASFDSDYSLIISDLDCSSLRPLCEDSEEDLTESVLNEVGQTSHPLSPPPLISLSNEIFNNHTPTTKTSPHKQKVIEISKTVEKELAAIPLYAQVLGAVSISMQAEEDEDKDFKVVINTNSK